MVGSADKIITICLREKNEKHFIKIKPLYKGKNLT